MSEGCTCQECVEMCRTHPCAPTVEEAKQLIKHGFAKRLMLKIWVSRDDPECIIVGLCPAIMGHEMGADPLKSHIGDCTFLKDERCELHNLKLKPSEGRFATHNTTHEQEESNTKEIIKTWLSNEGEALLHKWERICEIKIKGPGF
jgi:hypothetical protein